MEGLVVIIECKVPDDFNEAFDKINHNVTLSKFYGYAVFSDILTRFKS